MNDRPSQWAMARIKQNTSTQSCSDLRWLANFELGIWKCIGTGNKFGTKGAYLFKDESLLVTYNINVKSYTLVDSTVLLFPAIQNNARKLFDSPFLLLRRNLQSLIAPKLLPVGSQFLKNLAIKTQRQGM